MGVIYIGPKVHFMKFNILVNEGPYTHQASDTAYQFAKAAVDAGHEVIRVFFYHDGVYNANRLSTPPVDERDVVNQWVRLAREHQVELAVCITASLKRGVLSDQSANRYGKNSDNIGQDFKVAGVGYFIEGSIIADRTLIFGD